MNPPPVPRYRYFIFVLVMLMALLNYVDRGAISYAASSITHEYGFDKGAWGAVLGFFGYGYIFGALCGGILSDRFGPRRVWFVAGAAWAVFEIATAFAGDIGLSALCSGLPKVRLTPRSTRASPTGRRRRSAAS
jgi:ACS family hexuronate transporter-like MFS transporter